MRALTGAALQEPYAKTGREWMISVFHINYSGTKIDSGRSGASTTPPGSHTPRHARGRSARLPSLSNRSLGEGEDRLQPLSTGRVRTRLFRGRVERALHRERRMQPQLLRPRPSLQAAEAHARTAPHVQVKSAQGILVGCRRARIAAALRLRYPGCCCGKPRRGRAFLGRLSCQTRLS